MNGVVALALISLKSYIKMLLLNSGFEHWCTSKLTQNMNSFSNSKHKGKKSPPCRTWQRYPFVFQCLCTDSNGSFAFIVGWFTDCMNTLVSPGRRVHRNSYHWVPAQGSNRRTWTHASSTSHVAAFECSSETSPWLFHEDAPKLSGFNCAHASSYYFPRISGEITSRFFCICNDYSRFLCENQNHTTRVEESCWRRRACRRMLYLRDETEE